MSQTLYLTLTLVVCGCCVILCVFLTYLCVVVKRIRRKLDDLAKDRKISIEGASTKKKREEARNRTSSGNVRYTGEPLGKRTRDKLSSVYSDPDETITYLEREVRPGLSAVLQNKNVLVSGASTQDVGERQAGIENIPLKSYVNPAFSPEARRESSENLSEANDSQPIYGNEEVFVEEQPIYENNNEAIDEPIYQNRGELAAFNNPEWTRSNTLDITEVP